MLATLRTLPRTGKKAISEDGDWGRQRSRKTAIGEDGDLGRRRSGIELKCSLLPNRPGSQWIQVCGAARAP
ncbi:MAG: hypothetical protein AB4426_00665 [Xenococcaceae cyanobacterium]